MVGMDKGEIGGAIGVDLNKMCLSVYEILKQNKCFHQNTPFMWT